MKVVLLAGGFGTRISEESQFKPKPMVEIGGKPILWHIMKEYLWYGFNDFIICAGYKQQVIKKWFADYYLNNSDVEFDFTNGRKEMRVLESHCEPWKVTVVDTGLHTMTGGRIRRIRKYVGDEPFFMTYGDGVCDVNIRDLPARSDNPGNIEMNGGRVIEVEYIRTDGTTGHRSFYDGRAATSLDSSSSLGFSEGKSIFKSADGTQWVTDGSQHISAAQTGKQIRETNSIRNWFALFRKRNS